MSDEDPREPGVADRIVVSYRSPEAERDRERWPLAAADSIRDRLCRDSFIGYLTTVHRGEVDRGDQWNEFVGRGCGRSADVVLRVEAIESGATLGDETEIDIVHRRDVLPA